MRSEGWEGQQGVGTHVSYMNNMVNPQRLGQRVGDLAQICGCLWGPGLVMAQVTRRRGRGGTRFGAG